MNIFVLCTGRCGSLSFIKACSHIANYTAGHETRTGLLGKERFAYPENHIEADNRLSWLLGRLDKHYGDSAFYVHLLRQRESVAASYNKRWEVQGGIIAAYRQGILMQGSHKPAQPQLDYCMDYYDTVNSNIRLFLKDKSK